ncbi:MAG: thioredoxin family protein [Mobilitalea sp.]
MDDEIVKKSRTIWFKTLIVALIIMMIAGIYIYKKSNENKQSTQAAQELQELQSEQKINDSKVTPEIVQEEMDTKDIIQPLEISSVDLEEIKSYELPIVIDFGSDECIPCKQMAPVLVTLNEEWQGKAIIHFVDVWKNTNAANDFPVTVIPTQIFYNADGTPFVPSDELAAEIEFTKYEAKDTKEHLFTVHQGGITEEQMRKIFAEMGVE